MTKRFMVSGEINLSKDKSMKNHLLHNKFDPNNKATSIIFLRQLTLVLSSCSHDWTCLEYNGSNGGNSPWLPRIAYHETPENSIDHSIALEACSRIFSHYILKNLSIYTEFWLKLFNFTRQYTKNREISEMIKLKT